jgi:hypothetical protein
MDIEVTKEEEKETPEVPPTGKIIKKSTKNFDLIENFKF